MAENETKEEETPEIPVVKAINLNGGVIQIEKIPGLRTLEWLKLEDDGFSPKDAGNTDKMTVKVLHSIATMGLVRYDKKLTPDMVGELDFFELVAVANHVISKRHPPNFTKSSTS